MIWCEEAEPPTGPTLGPLFVFVTVWQLSRLGDDFLAILAGWTGAVVVLSTVLIAATIANRCGAGLRLGCVLFTLATMSGLVYWNISGGLDTFKLRGDLLHGSRPSTGSMVLRRISRVSRLTLRWFWQGSGPSPRCAGPVRTFIPSEG